MYLSMGTRKVNARSLMNLTLESEFMFGGDSAMS